MSAKNLFTDHPEAVGETYLEHMRTALSFAGPLAVAAGAAFVHAFLPFLCETSASRRVKQLYARMTNRVPRAGVAADSRLADSRLAAWDPVI